MPEEGINPVEFPALLWQEWEWFERLDSRREMGFSGPGKIGESTIAWFFRNRGISPQEWQLDLIHILDNMACQARNVSKKKASK